MQKHIRVDVHRGKLVILSSHVSGRGGSGGVGGGGGGVGAGAILLYSNFFGRKFYLLPFIRVGCMGATRGKLFSDSYLLVTLALMAPL